jgi:hypothetical protein
MPTSHSPITPPTHDQTARLVVARTAAANAMAAKSTIMALQQQLRDQAGAALEAQRVADPFVLPAALDAAVDVAVVLPAKKAPKGAVAAAKSFKKGLSKVFAKSKAGPSKGEAAAAAEDDLAGAPDGAASSGGSVAGSDTTDLVCLMEVGWVGGGMEGSKVVEVPQQPGCFPFFFKRLGAGKRCR